MSASDRQGPGKDRPLAEPLLSEAEGVDVGLIRWMLSLSPRERLSVLQQNVNSILRLRQTQRGK